MLWPHQTDRSLGKFPGQIEVVGWVVLAVELVKVDIEVVESDASWASVVPIQST